MRAAKALTTAALNLLFPPQCMVCDALVATHGTLCLTCWHGIHFISDPICARCGVPLEYAAGADALCTDCLKHPPAFTLARSVVRYDPASKALVLKLKFQDDTALAATFGPWLMKAAHTMPKPDYIVPVPLHYGRFIQRRYNQAALLANALARASGIPLVPDALTRTRATPQQTTLRGKARRENVARAFAVHPRHLEALRGKNVLLVDDVFTTGATLNACTEALHTARVRDVYVVTLARRVKLHA